MMITSQRLQQVLPVASILVFIAIWQVAATFGWINRNILASPVDLAVIGVGMVADGSIFINSAISLARVITGFAIGAAAGVLVGLGMGQIERVRIILNPLVEVLRPIPPLAWIPLAIIWFGIGEQSKIFLIAVTAFFPVVVNSFKGVVGMDPTLIRAARAFDVTQRKMLLQVTLPAAMPDIATGLRIAWSLSFAVLVAAEMIAAKSGLGFLVTDAMNLGRFDVVVFGIVMIGSLSVATDYVLRLLIAKYLLFWHRGLDSAEG